MEIRMNELKGKTKSWLTERELISMIMFLSIIMVQEHFSWGYLYCYFICLVYFARLNFKLDIRSLKFPFSYYILPNILVLIHALGSMYVYKETFYLSRALNNFVLSVVLVFIAYELYKLHQSRAIKILTITLILYYMTKIGEALINVGPFTLLRHIFIPGSPVLSHWLEGTDLGLSIGFLIIYYVFYKKEKNFSFRYIIPLFIIFYLCFKRIAIGALVVTSLYIIVSNKMIDKKNRMMRIWGIVGVAICLTVVFFMTSNAFTNWLWHNGINVMGRDNLYRFFRPYFTFSLSFFGRGNGFTGKMLLSGVSVIEGSINTAAALHSDILRVFIEYGFVGSILWYSYYLVYLPKKIKEKDIVYSEVMFACTIYAFIIYITDNSTYYTIFQTLYLLVPLCASNRKLIIKTGS